MSLDEAAVGNTAARQRDVTAGRLDRQCRYLCRRPDGIGYLTYDASRWRLAAMASRSEMVWPALAAGEGAARP